MRVKIFVPSGDGFDEHEADSHVIPAIDAEFKIRDDAGLELVVDHVVYLLEQATIVPQIWLKDVSPSNLDEWISSVAS